MEKKAACGSCGNAVKATAKFCSSCGKPVASSSPSKQEKISGDEDEIFHWAQYQAAKCGYNVENWTASWADGIAFCAIIHIHRSDLMGRVDNLPLNDRRGNLQLALAAASKLGIRNIMTVDEFLSPPQPPKDKVLLFLSALYEKFAATQQKSVPMADASSATSAESKSSSGATAFKDLPNMPGLSNGQIDWQNKQLQNFLKSLEVAKRTVLGKEPCGNCGKPIPEDDNCGEKNGVIYCSKCLNTPLVLLNLGKKK